MVEKYKMLGQCWCLYWKDNRKCRIGYLLILGRRIFEISLYPILDQTMEHLKPKIPNIKDLIIAGSTTARHQDIYLCFGLKLHWLAHVVWPPLNQVQRSHVGCLRGISRKGSPQFCQIFLKPKIFYFKVSFTHSFPIVCILQPSKYGTFRVNSDPHPQHIISDILPF